MKSDVYGFGVVLLEILSGQRAFDATRPSEKEYLVEWAKPYLSDYTKLTRVMDPKLRGRYLSKGALQVAQLTLQCLSPDRKSRPSMKEVLEVLEQQTEAMKMKKSGDSSSRSRACNGGHVSHPLPLPPRHNGAGPTARVPCHSSKER